MNESEAVNAYLKERGIGEVSICSMDRQKFLLVGDNGRRYHEVKTNVWAEIGSTLGDVVYLGTGRHGGGIVLRPLFVLMDDTWVNATTGREAPAGMP